MEENREILQLLQQIEKANRRQTLCCILLCILALIAAAACIVTFVTVGQIIPQVMEVLPQITGVLPEITEVISQMQVVLANLETTSAQLAELDLTSMISDVNDLVTTGQQSLEATMSKLDGIDFQTLNKAIKDLSAVVEPLAKMSSLFR